MKNSDENQGIDRSAFIFDLRALFAKSESAFSSPRIDAMTLNRLDYLTNLTGGAVAIISDLEIAKMKAILKTLSDKVYLIGSHGGEFKDRENNYNCAMPSSALDAVRLELSDFIATQKPAYAVNKKLSISAHFGAAPELRRPLYQALSQAALNLGNQFQVIEGHYCWELKESRHNKGFALTSLNSRREFIDKVPFFFGADESAESAFLTIKLLGGKSVLLDSDDRITRANYKMSDVTELDSWIQQLCATQEIPELTRAMPRRRSLAA